MDVHGNGHGGIRKQMAKRVSVQGGKRFEWRVCRESAYSLKTNDTKTQENAEAHGRTLTGHRAGCRKTIRCDQHTAFNEPGWLNLGIPGFFLSVVLVNLKYASRPRASRVTVRERAGINVAALNFRRVAKLGSDDQSPGQKVR